MAGKILVTPRSVSKFGHPSLDKLRAAGFEVVFPEPGVQPGEQELLSILPGCIGYLAGVEPVSAAVLKAASGLKVISRNGTGINNIDLVAAKQENITVLRADGANARGVAELAIGLMLSLARSIPFSDAHLKKQGWERRKGFELENKTLGLIGCGKIGQLTARMAMGLGMKVVAFDPYPDASFKLGDGFEMATFPEVLRRADILSLHCPPLKDRPLVDAEFLRQCKPGVFIVNTARGELIDEPAMLAALESGAVGGIAMDAFYKEPPGANALVSHPLAIATPHIGALTGESVDRACDVAVENLLQYFRKSM